MARPTSTRCVTAAPSSTCRCGRASTCAATCACRCWPTNGRRTSSNGSATRCSCTAATGPTPKASPTRWATTPARSSGSTTSVAAGCSATTWPGSCASRFSPGESAAEADSTGQKPVTVGDGAKVLVLGLGSRQGGAGVVRYLHGIGACVRVSDRSDRAQLADAMAALADIDGVTYHLGGEDVADVNWADVVVRNPAVPADSPMLQHARAHGTPIEMEMTLFLRACPAPVIGVTGTKGKTTTTALLHAMLRRRWPDAVSAGNMGRSALAELDAAALDPSAPVSLELSSFQLESMGEHRMSPHVAVVTNIAPDHLDRYPSFEAYAETKAAIWRHQRAGDHALLPADDVVVQRLAHDVPGHRTDYGMPAGTDRLAAAGVDLGPRDSLRGPGRHAALDAIAAATAALTVGVEPDAVVAAIAGFAGVPHRMEPVATIDGVDYVNDTAATTPIAAVAALEAHAARDV